MKNIFVKFNKSYFYNKYLFIFLIFPLFVIPFLQSDKLLDTSLQIRFLAVNMLLLFFCFFYVFSKISFKLNSIGFFIFYFIYIIYSAISIIISTRYGDSAFYFIMIANLGILVFFYYLLFFNYDINYNFITKVFGLLGLLVLILAFFDYFKILISTGITHQSIYNIKATFSHKNILSEVLFILLPFSLFLLFNSNKWFKVLGVLNSIGILFLLIILLTRAVWLSVILGFLLTSFFFILISGKEKLIIVLKSKKTYIFIISSVFIIASSLFIYSKMDSFETIKKSTIKIFNTYDSSQHRIELWKRSIDLAKENLIFGNGLGTWRIEVLKYGNRNLQSKDNITFYQRPHNDFLWILAEQGIIGLFLFVSQFLFIFYYLYQLIKKSTSFKESIFFYLLFYLLIGYLIFSFFSFPKERIEHSLFLGIIFGFIIAKYHLLKDTKPIKFLNIKYQRIIFGFIFLILIFHVNVAYSRFKSEFHLRKAFEARQISNWNSVIIEINNSESAFYQIDPFSTPLKWYSGEAYFKSGDVENAFKDYKKSSEINPYHIHVLNNLATCYEIKGDHFKAIENYNKAIQISPSFDDALLNLTAVYYNLGYLDSALREIMKVDTISKNEKYLPFIKTIVNKKIDLKIETIGNKLLIDVLGKINSDNDWKLNIFFKSRLNCINFENQLLMDCLYILKDIDKKIDEDEYLILKRKYLKINN